MSGAVSSIRTCYVCHIVVAPPLSSALNLNGLIHDDERQPT